MGEVPKKGKVLKLGQSKKGRKKEGKTAATTRRNTEKHKTVSSRLGKK